MQVHSSQLAVDDLSPLLWLTSSKAHPSVPVATSNNQAPIETLACSCSGAARHNSRRSREESQMVSVGWKLCGLLAWIQQAQTSARLGKKERRLEVGAKLFVVASDCVRETVKGGSQRMLFQHRWNYSSSACANGVRMRAWRLPKRSIEALAPDS